MKRILFVAFATTLLAASCSKTEVINPEGNQIGFSTKMAKLTKAYGTADADAEGIVNLQAQDFRLWVYADFEDPYTTDVTELDQIYDKMEGINVTYTPASGESQESWAPAADYYWPGKNKALRFFAVSGEGTHNVDVKINRTNETTVAPTVTIAEYVVNNANPNTDLMVADFVRQDQTKTNVELDFRHALTKVEFLFKTNDTKDGAVFVQSVSVGTENSGVVSGGLATKSTLTVSAPSGAEFAAKDIFTWATPVEPKVFTDDYVTPTTSENFPASFLHLGATENAAATDIEKQAMELNTTATNFCTWLAMPQTLADKKVRVVYVIGTRQFENYFDLATTSVTAWEENQHIKYTVTLAPNKISFSGSVDEWSTEDPDTETL